MSPITLVLLPGMEGTGQLFAPLIEEIADSHPVQALRYPSDSTAGYRELIEHARAALPTDRDYVLLGESFSGPIAIALAAESPPGLKGLILSGSFVTSPQPRLGLYASLMPYFPMRIATSMPAMRILLGKYATLPLCRMLQVAIRSVASRTLHARLGAIASVDVAAELARVTVPLMYLQARNDMLVPPSAAETIQRIQPTSKIVQVDGPHFLLQVNPRQASESIRQFIAGLQPTG